MHIAPELAFKITPKIHPFDQDAIIEEAIAHGYTAKAQPFWIKHDVRSLIPESIEGTYEEKAPGDFFYRLDPRTRWRWENNDAAARLRPMIESVGHLFKKLTRVKVFVQIPGMDIAPHRDLIPGNEYRFIGGPTKAKLGMWHGVFQGHPNLIVEQNTRHRDQSYLNLKIPLSSKPGDSGLPFMYDDGVKKYMKSDDHFYFLDEYTSFHGADAVDFHRGVVFVDGILDPDRVEAAVKQEFEWNS